MVARLPLSPKTEIVKDGSVFEGIHGVGWRSVSPLDCVPVLFDNLNLISSKLRERQSAASTISHH